MLFRSIETVSEGEIFLCEEIDTLLIKKKSDDVIWLSNREKEVLKYIAEGYTTNEIAANIFRGVEAVRSQRRNLLIKMNAKNMAVMVKKAYDMKLIW